MTAVFVIMTGILGSMIGPAVMRIFRIRGDIARGVLFGTSAHGTGTSKAFEFSSLSGTISSISMIVAALHPRNRTTDYVLSLLILLRPDKTGDGRFLAVYFMLL